MSIPCTQQDRLARMETKLDTVIEQLGHAGDPLTGKAPQGLVAIVMEQRQVNARVTALEESGEATRAKHKAALISGVKLLLPLLFGVGLAKADAIVNLFGLLVR
jgi:hypothetical protein